MPFYAFDPRSGPPDPLESVKTAIEKQGFVGVKLYPPLGYKPIGNDDPKVENALTALYEYGCKNKNNPIPITAHCSWSAGGYSNERVPGTADIKTYYRSMGHPSHWRKVLEKFPALKLNLAHFGGLGEWEALAINRKPREKWVDAIVDLLNQYDHVYTDLSFHGLPATKLADQYKKVLLEKIKDVERKVLFGSDWYMSRMQCTLADYWQGFEELFKDLPDLFDKMTGENAIAFLRSDATAIHFPKFFKDKNRQIFDDYPKIFN